MSWAVAEPGDIDSVSACIASAFATDPIWSVALSRADGASVITSKAAIHDHPKTGHTEPSGTG
jgi:hypothetical protein